MPGMFRRVCFSDVSLGEAVDHFGNSLGRDRPDGQAVRPAVFGPLAADHDLEMGNGVAADVAAVAVEADVGDVVLAAGVEAAADLDVQVADGFVEAASTWPRAGAHSPARPREEAMPSLQVSVPGQAETSTIVPAPPVREADRFELVVQIDQFSAGHPAEDHVLVDRRAGMIARVSLRRSGELADLLAGSIAEGQGDGHDRVAGLPLA